MLFKFINGIAELKRELLAKKGISGLPERWRVFSLMRKKYIFKK
jgi:hypothetical protein